MIYSYDMGFRAGHFVHGLIKTTGTQISLLYTATVATLRRVQYASGLRFTDRRTLNLRYVLQGAETCMYIQYQ